MDGRKSAFTLVEAILTIAIMGILAVVVLPHFVKAGFIEGLTLRSAASQIASDIRYTRRLAIANSGQYTIRFNLNSNEYSIISPTNQTIETKKIPSDITCSGTDQFDFYPLGNCSYNGGGLFISIGTTQYKIVAEPPTGAVVIEKIS